MENNSMAFVTDTETFLSYRNLLPYALYEEVYDAWRYHGTSGRVSVRNAPPSFPNFYQKFYSAVHNALDLHENSDINGYFYFLFLISFKWVIAL